jgi:hypothetical protein
MGSSPCVRIDPDRAVETEARKGLFELFLHDINQKQAILRQATAVGYGLDPGQAGLPFPGHTTQVRGIGGVAVVFILLTMVLALAVGAGVAIFAAKLPAPSEPTVAPPAVTASPEPSGTWSLELVQ